MYNTEQKKSEKIIAKEKELSDSIINNLPGVFYMYDEDGKFLRWNKNFENISGYTTEEIQYMHPLDFYDTNDKQKIKKRIETVFKENSPGMEVNILRKDGKKIAYFINSWSITLGNKKYLTGMGIDLTERYKAEEKLTKSYEEIRQLASHLQNVREEERASMAREIHDELGQQITGLKMDISWLSKKLITEDETIRQKISKIIELLDGTVKTVRKMATELRPSILDDLGLVEAMEWQSQEFQKRSGIKVQFQSTDFKKHLPDNINIGLFRIYQESLTNVARHANATKVTTTFQQKDNSLVLTILDNGKGFDIKDNSNKKTLGLLGMKERTLMMGGEYKIISNKEDGTKVIVSVPLQV